MSFEVRKQSGGEFWIALEEIYFNSGHCPDDPNAVPHIDGRLAGWYLVMAHD